MVSDWEGVFRRGAGALGANWFQQEYMGEFVDNGASVFGRELVEACLDDSVEVMVFD